MVSACFKFIQDFQLILLLAKTHKLVCLIKRGIFHKLVIELFYFLVFPLLLIHLLRCHQLILLDLQCAKQLKLLFLCELQVLLLNLLSSLLPLLNRLEQVDKIVLFDNTDYLGFIFSQDYLILLLLAILVLTEGKLALFA